VPPIPETLHGRSGSEMIETGIESCLFGTVSIQLMRLPVCLDGPSHADSRTVFYLTESGFHADWHGLCNLAR
jgi:hypothetical protein